MFCDNYSELLVSSLPSRRSNQRIRLSFTVDDRSEFQLPMGSLCAISGDRSFATTSDDRRLGTQVWTVFEWSEALSLGAGLQ
jgi:hypothetical protein